MNIVVTGATGFIGRALLLALRRQGHEVAAVTREPEAAAGWLEPSIARVDLNDDHALREAIERADAVVNLAGAPVLGGRWSAGRKQELVRSRVGLTKRLVELMREAGGDKALVSGSAVGYYGDAGDTVCLEHAAPAADFLAELCRDWEAEALAARDQGVRVVVLRTGVVLGPEGGALAQMVPPFKLGVGGRVGSGRQYMPWIHLEDHVAIILEALTNPKMQGAYNATAPTPVTNSAFTKALGKVLARPTLAPVPGLALKAIFGDAASVLLTGQNAPPARLLDAGFHFAHPTVDAALDDILGAGKQIQIGPPDQLPASDYLSRRQPSHLLEASVIIDAPLDEVFAFFSKAENLGVITPPTLAFEKVDAPPAHMTEGLLIDYRIKLGPVPMRWRTRIEAWVEGQRFVDSQIRGPYRCWYHEHHFEAAGEQTVMTDRVWYAPPLGPLGRLTNRLFIAPMLRRIFGYRTAAIRLRFGLGERALPQRRADA